jgi:hypothetical protein
LGSERLRYLDELVEEVATGDLGRYGPLSTGERLYIALAENRADLLKQDGFTIVQAVDRLGEDWMACLLDRWKVLT